MSLIIEHYDCGDESTGWYVYDDERHGEWPANQAGPFRTKADAEKFKRNPKWRTMKEVIASSFDIRWRR